MRHRIKGRKLGRSTSHRTATLRALATALIKNKKITTTVAKAKQTRLFVEPLITKAKNDTVHARRLVAQHIHDKEVLKELFNEVIPKIGDRPGGYTRVLKLGNRVGDAAEMAIIELVDYNDLSPAKEKKKSKAKKAKKTVEKVTDAAEAEVAEKEIEEAEVEEVDSEEIKDEKADDQKADQPKEVKSEKKKDESDASKTGDDLTKIEGVGPKISEILNNAGITTFKMIAESEPEKISEILAAAGSRYKSHDPATWPEQAELAAEGKWDELKKRQDELSGGRE